MIIIWSRNARVSNKFHDFRRHTCIAIILYVLIVHDLLEASSNVFDFVYFLPLCGQIVLGNH